MVPPTEIVFLRTTVPAYGAYQFGTYDVMFEIQDGNADRAFDVVKRIENGVYVGESARSVLYVRALGRTALGAAVWDGLISAQWPRIF